MRLVCPNCEAKYEVPDDAIPETGRDVQCANCGHAWFQMRNKALVPESAPEAAPVPVLDSVPVAEPAPVAAATAAEPTGPEDTPADDRVSEHVDEDVEEISEREPEIAEIDHSSSEPSVAPEADVIAKPPLVEELPRGPAPYAVDDSVLAILREEAQRESQARKSEIRPAQSAPLEDQPDLGLDSTLIPPAKTAAPFVIPDEAPGRSSARRDLLPDVEEINSSLRPSERPVHEDVDNEDTPVVTRRQGGFRSGFLWVMALAIIATAVYISAPTLAAMIPALAEPLNSFVGIIDTLRLQLDGLMQSATMALNGN